MIVASLSIYTVQELTKIPYTIYSMKKTAIVALLLVIIALGGFFRFFRLADTPPGLYPDEAMNGNNALEALATTNFFAQGGPSLGWKVFYPENNGREGLFINLQAISLWLFGNEPWALRAVSAIIGVLTILGVYLVTKELLKKQEVSSKYQGNETPVLTTNYLLLDTHAVALLSSFFLATSYWHITFSRIGFRAIMVPLITTFALYFLLKGLRTGRISSLIAAGVFAGLGFHTYIAYRIFPLVLAVPIGFSLWSWWKMRDANIRMHTNNTNKKCTPCAVLLFIIITLAVVSPLALHFINNPEDFASRTGQISIFSAQNPLLEYVKSDLLTTGMLFIRGDCNWRHNYACRPELNPIVAFFFLVGLITAIAGLTKPQNTSTKSQTDTMRHPEAEPKELEILRFTQDDRNVKFVYSILLAWLVIMSFPATLTREGIPHALRSIGMIPPVMIVAGLGAYHFYEWLFLWFEKQKARAPDISKKLTRIQKELAILLLGVLLLIPIFTYRNYFVYWANRPETYFAFSTDLLHLGQYLRDLPPDVQKYVIVNMPGTEVRGLPMPAQTPMFATNTFGEEKREKRNIRYLLPAEVNNQLSVISNQPTVIALMNGMDTELKNALTARFPDFRIYAPGDFVILQNF